MKRMDLNCYCGNWPFFRVRYNTPEKLMQLHRRCGIESAFVSSCEAIFYQDPYEAEKQLSKALAGTAYMHVMTLNPMLNGWKDDLKRAVEELQIKAVRLMPGFHDYSLSDPVLNDVADALRNYQLPLFLTLRIRDERTNWIFHPKSVPLDEVADFLERTSDILTLLCCARRREVASLKSSFDARSNLFTDTSGFKDGNFAIEEACEIIGHEKVVYGSSAPLIEMQSTAILVDRAQLPESTRNDIFSGACFTRLLK